MKGGNLFKENMNAIVINGKKLSENFPKGRLS